jgi:osmotically-inducible protein OsmY
MIDTSNNSAHSNPGIRSFLNKRTGDNNMKLLKYFSAILAAVMLTTALGCASTSKQEGTGEYMDDSLITTKVKAAVFNEPSLKSSEINVETFKGVVQLSGFVNSQADINKAVEVARSVKGVTSVKNDMRVK